ncbi:hypothetical protein BJ878DRAFT_543588 [Calycina marina]|uniref:Vacuolar protein sorting-associated protein n=1 Tax=Calycina marina TaxID=1763456 RepID=A0A9P8CFA5_9HELO|nr:hypothetical protein BJ878DRAFT_543588 [Calycina marina]
MLEGLVAAILGKFLPQYVSNFNASQLQVGIWSGDVKLQNLELKKEALDRLHLPINVVAGRLGQLTLNIPWSKLGKEAVKVVVEDVTLLVAPKEESKYDAEDEERRDHQNKINKLEEADIRKNRDSEGASAEEQTKNESFTTALINKIIANLQITVKNIHIRYEDSISDEGHPFSVGVMLEEFSAHSTDDMWNPAFIQNASGTNHKIASLSSLAVYWDTDTKLLGTGRESEADESKASPQDLMTTLKEMILTADKPDLAGHQFILKPVTGRAKIEMNHLSTPEKAKNAIGLLFDEIGLVVDEEQYRDAVMLYDTFRIFNIQREYKKMKPTATVKEDPKAWLRFAGEAVQSKIHERNRRWSWEFFKERRDDRIRYIELFKKKSKPTEQLGSDETVELDKLERKQDFAALRFWRSLARNQLKKENVGVRKEPPKQGWVAWAWGSKPQDQDPDPEITMTDEQRKELYDVIEFDERAAIAKSVDAPRDAIDYQIDALLNTGSFTLRRRPHSKAVDLVGLYSDGFRAKCLFRPESFLIDAKLGGLRVIDGTTPDSLFTHIVRVKDAPDEPLAKVQLDGPVDDLVDPVDPLFQFQFENNPLDGTSDRKLTAKLKPLEVIWNPQFVVGIVQFFKPPDKHLESITALMERARATVEELRQQTRAGLEYALEEHKTLNVDLNLRAPLFIIPENIAIKTTPCLILDAGHVSVNSELIDRATIKDIQSKQKHAYTTEDKEHLQSLMYDKFIVKLTSTQLLIGPSIEETKQQLVSKNESKYMHIVEKINMDFVVQQSIIAQDPTFAKIRVSGRLPLLHAMVSDANYKRLMRLIDVAVPNFDDSESTPQSANSQKLMKTHSRAKSSTSVQSGKPRDRAVSTSFQFSTQEAVIIHDSDDDDDDDAEFQDASSGTVDESLKIQQRFLELQFKVDRLQGSLFRSDSAGKKPDELLVEVVADDFNLALYMRPYDMIIEPSLGSITVDDHVESTSAEFKSIVSSGDRTTDVGHEGDLVRIRIVMVKPNSPELMSVYDGARINIDVDISTINLIVTRVTLLTLLDFVLVTFTNDAPDPAPTSPQLELSGEDSDDEDVGSQVETTSNPIRIKINLVSVNLILNNDGIRLATLSLTTAAVKVFLPGPKTMRIEAKLGNLTLLDDVNQGASENSDLRKIITIQGDQLADFQYRTFDSESEAYPGHDTLIYLRAGSLKLNFMEEPVRKIIDFLVKFGDMQAAFDRARRLATDGANQIQNSSSKMVYDIKINTPIIVFPRVMKEGQSDRDLLTAYLGEIYAINKFVPLDDSAGAPIATKIEAGIRNIRLTSKFHFDHGDPEELELIDKLDLEFRLTKADHVDESRRPDVVIEGNMSDLNLRITQVQLKFLLELANSVPATFVSEPSEIEQQALEDSPKPPEDLPSDTKSTPTLPITSQRTEVSDRWTRLEVAFLVHKIGLELVLAKEDEPVRNVDMASLSRFSLDDTHLQFALRTDDSFEAELIIHSFTIQDSRRKTTNKFPKIMGTINKRDLPQFMVNVKKSGGTEPHINMNMELDSPRIIFSLDYVFALQAFVAGGLSVDEPLELGDEDSSESLANESDIDSMTGTSIVVGQSKNSESTSRQESKAVMTMAIEIVVGPAEVILIANPLSSTSEAILLKIETVTISKQQSITLNVLHTEMFLCRMDSFKTARLRILDDFSLRVGVDMSKLNTKIVHVDMDAIVLRLSLRDILLALQIVQKASELSGFDDHDEISAADLKTKQLGDSGSGKNKQQSVSKRGTSTVAKRPKTATRAPSSNKQNTVTTTKSTVCQKEKLTANLRGMRIVLIGDRHELPIFDLMMKDLNVMASNWSSTLKVESQISSLLNAYNFSKSVWEPLYEPWDLTLLAARDDAGYLSIEASSEKRLEVTVSSSVIALASKSIDFLSQDTDILSKPRDHEKPYRIHNYTGFEVSIWMDHEPGAEAIKLDDGAQEPWSFEDWEQLREKLFMSKPGTLCIRLEGSGFEPISEVEIDKEGEELYRLRSQKGDSTQQGVKTNTSKVQGKTREIRHQLLVEVELAVDNVKIVTLRSPLVVVNNTQIPVELAVYDAAEGHLLKIEKIPPGEARPAPVGAAHLHSLVVRPDQGFGYAWSTEVISWRELITHPTRTLTCKGEDEKETAAFYFQMNALFDKSEVIATDYPVMRILLSPPVVLENLLPYDFKYRIYDKNTKKDWTNFLRKGGVSPVHVVELSHLLLLSIDMQDTAYKPSEFAIINSNNRDFRTESNLICRDDAGLTLKLNINRVVTPDSGGAFKITVYSPYIILNKTGMQLNMKSKSLLSQAKTTAGQGMYADAANTERRKALPYMFAFPSKDQKNRALIKIGDSDWSKPQSLDAIGAVTDVTIPLMKDSNKEIHVGITVESGEGKYKLTSVVTIAPRFVLVNHLAEEILVREPGSAEVFTLKPEGADNLKALDFLQTSESKQLSMCLPGVTSIWSAPFNISNIGSTHVKMSRKAERQKLRRVEILMEHATLFLHIYEETNSWPLSIRNESDTEFIFYQSKPNPDYNNETDASGWRIIRYCLPPRSIMPYSWDFPAVNHPDMCIIANGGKPRYIRVNEIGALVPMKVPIKEGSSTSKAIDVNVATDGPTMVLILSNYKASKSLYKQKSQNESSAGVGGGFEVKSQKGDTRLLFRAQLKIAGLGISLIDHLPRELVYITLLNITIGYNDFPLYQVYTASVGWIQADNQIYGGLFPIVLYPSVLTPPGKAATKDDAKEAAKHPAIHMQVQRVKDDSFGVEYIKYATVLLQQMTIELDEDFIMAIIEFSKVPGASWSETSEDGVLCDENLDIPTPNPAKPGKDLYFELLNMQPMQLDLSFVRTDVRDEGAKTTTHNPLMFFFNVLTMAVGNINDAQLRLNSLVLENVRQTPTLLVQNFSNFYSQQCINQMHRIIGSADFLGNPVGLFNNLSSGVADIFYEPYMGLVMSGDRPEELGLGIAKGATSFFKKSVFGFSDSFSKVTGSIAKGLAEATMDKEFQRRRRQTKSRNKPKHALYGVTTGAKSFADSFASGVGGLARKPLEGAEQEGVAGFFKGMGKGVVGFATKPALGVFDLASNVSEGIRNTTTVFDDAELERVRYPRFIEHDGIIRPFNSRNAIGQHWLREIDNGKYDKEEYIGFYELEGKNIMLFVTYAKILHVDTSRREMHCTFEVPFTKIAKLSKERTGLSITLAGGTPAPFIPIPDDHGRAYFCDQLLQVALKDWNKNYQRYKK